VNVSFGSTNIGLMNFACSNGLRALNYFTKWHIYRALDSIYWGKQCQDWFSKCNIIRYMYLDGDGDQCQCQMSHR
jgi:hypothetical protein